VPAVSAATIVKTGRKVNSSTIELCESWAKVLKRKT
jgi:hypothetical protein